LPYQDTWITCYDSTEDKGEGSNQGKNTYSCEGNTFTNCTFQNASQYGVLFDNVAHDSPAASNTFDHCTFQSGGTVILHRTSNNNGNRIINSTITGYAACEDYDGGSGNVAFANNLVANNGFLDGCGSGAVTNHRPVHLRDPQWLGTAVQFQFVSEAATTNTVESRTNLALGTWEERTNILGDGTLKTVTLPLANSPVEFFRVRTR
jgi:hypothetical protein